MRLLKWGSKMPSTKQYNLVTNDDYDTRIPLHSEEAFQYGITFHAKYIGTMDVPRPTSRVEIVAAMRRIRYEFKAKGVKKKKVTVEVSIDGVRVTVRKKKVAKKKEGNKLFGGNSNNEAGDSAAAATGSADAQELMLHPIYRIFYVSHDSSDLKIFSYIARDGATNLFKCNVFKSTKKSQAMRIVRTVGQAFEVCHKLTSGSPEPTTTASCSAHEDANATSVVSDRASETSAKKEAVSDVYVSAGSSNAESAGGASTSGAGGGEGSVGGEGEEAAARPQILDLLPPPPRKNGRRSPHRTIPSPSLNIPELPECVRNVELASSSTDGGSGLHAPTTPLSAQHELQLLKEQLEQQSQQTRAAVAQLLLLRDQLAAEQAARCEAQARTHQLLMHNKELLDHITALVAHLQERERGSRPISVQQLTMVPQSTPTTPLQEATNQLDNSFTYKNDMDPNDILNLYTKNLSINRSTYNLQNNNIPMDISPIFQTANVQNHPVNNNISNDQLLNRFTNMGGFPQTADLKHFNQQFFQNCNAFPNIPLLANHYSSWDLASQFNQNNIGSSNSNPQPYSSISPMQSHSSLCTPSSQSVTSKDSRPDAFSSDEGVSFIMPLSHAGTLTTTDVDGRVRVIVPVSPSDSTTDVGQDNNNDLMRQNDNKVSMVTLNVTDETGVTRRALPITPPIITRTSSEKVPNRSEIMATMRSQWTRHTTK